MALLWIEGFETCGTSAGNQITDYLDQKYQYAYAGSHVWYIQDGRTGGFSCKGNQNNGRLITGPLTTDNTLIFGCGICPLSTSTYGLVYFQDMNSVGITIKYSASTGEISVYRGTSTLLGTTTGAGIAVDTWTYVEGKIVIDNSAGSVIIKTGAVERLNLSGIDTQQTSNAYCDRFAIGTNYSAYIDDVYLCDSTGSMNNDWLGILKVVGVVPDGDGGTLQWTPSSGVDHYALVNEIPESSGYVDSDTAGQTDLWTYGDLSLGGAIYGVQINTIVEETGSKSYDLYMPIESNSTVYDGNSKYIGTTSKVNRCRIAETDPDTGSLWTESGFNAAKFGVKTG